MKPLDHRLLLRVSLVLPDEIAAVAAADKAAVIEERVERGRAGGGLRQRIGRRTGPLVSTTSERAGG